jgi:hypothetical protein
MRPIRSVSWILLFLGVGASVPAGAQQAPAGHVSGVAYLLAGGTSFMGYLPGGTPFDFHNLQFQQILSKQLLLGSAGAVKLANLAQTDLSSTYGVRFRGWDHGIASERYQAAAFLATQIPNARPDEARSLQRAMWGLMGVTYGTGGPVSSQELDPGVRILMSEGLVGANTVDAAQWTIASDVRMAGTATNEFLVQSTAAEQSVVPEPDVILLLAGGLLALGAIAHFRGGMAI